MSDRAVDMENWNKINILIAAPRDEPEIITNTLNVYPSGYTDVFGSVRHICSGPLDEREHAIFKIVKRGETFKSYPDVRACARYIHELDTRDHVLLIYPEERLDPRLQTMLCENIINPNANVNRCWVVTCSVGLLDELDCWIRSCRVKYEESTDDISIYKIKTGKLYGLERELFDCWIIDGEVTLGSLYWSGHLQNLVIPLDRALAEGHLEP